jgi:putative transposase
MPKLASDPVDDGWRIPDELWTYLEPLLPEPAPHPKGGRPWTAARQALDGMFFVLRTGCQWKALPRCFGAPSTVHERFVQWRKAGVFDALWRVGLREFDERVGLDWEWQAMDGAMTKAPLGGGGALGRIRPIAPNWAPNDRC